MKTTELTVGMKIRHPNHGIGTVENIAVNSAEIRFTSGMMTVDPELAEIVPAEPQVKISELDMPLKQFVAQTIETILTRLGHENPNTVIEQLGLRWHKGKLVLHPADQSLQTKEVPLEVFFHKIVGLRNQLRVLEQKINAHPTLTDAEKVEMQQYITRSYGSLTTFNILFKEKEDQF